MIRKHFSYYFSSLGADIAAGVVVFLVALPLCLGIAMASGAPLLSGVIAGVVGGLAVSLASGSQLSVSGPAAGLTVIVLQAIGSLRSFEALLTATMLAGALQLALGFMRAGIVGAYFPSSVIKGMLSAIGLILIVKQLPHAVGYGGGLAGEETYTPEPADYVWAELYQALHAISPGAAVVSVVSILVMLLWETRPFRRLAAIPGPLVAVAWGVAFGLFARDTPFAIADAYMVRLPEMQGLGDFVGHLRFPDFSQLSNPAVYPIAFTLAIVASLETLLSLEAIDKLDPLKRVAPTDRELKAQGFGNLLSGLLGGIPLTAVIVRGSVNVNAGAKTKLSSFVHGALLLASVSFLARYLNCIPLSALAAILLLTGYKLAKPSLMRAMYRKGIDQFVPYAVTVAAILATDLLEGIAVGVACGLFYVVKANFHAALSLTQNGNHYLLRLNKDVSFLNKALLRELLDRVEPNGELIVDGSRAGFIDQDILETLSDFLQAAPDDGIEVSIKSVAGLKPKALPAPPGKAVTPAYAHALSH